MEAYQKPEIADMFDHVFEKPTWTMEKQKQAVYSLGGKS